MALVVPDDFRDDEVQELAGELGVEVGVLGQPLEAGDLHALARRVGGRQAVLRLEHADGLGVLEALGEGEDQDRVEPVDRLAVAAQEVGGAADGVGAGHGRASGAGWRKTRSRGRRSAPRSSVQPSRRARAIERRLSGLT